MASRILLFLKLFGTRVPRTSVALNSWATVCLWRRYFHDQEEDEEGRRIEASHDISHNQIPVDNSSSPTDADVSNETTSDLVRSEWARRELSDFLLSTSSREHLKRSSYTEHRLPPSDERHITPATSPVITLDHPDLRVNGMFLPQ